MASGSAWAVIPALGTAHSIAISGNALIKFWRFTVVAARLKGLQVLLGGGL